MKNLIYILSVALIFASCKQEANKDFVTFSGTISNPNSDSLIIAQRGIIKTIKVDANGSFSDTLSVEPGNYIFFDGKERASLFLKNGYDLNLSLDTKMFDETLKYEGKGAEPNNYLVKKAILQEKIIDYEELMSMSKTDFDKKMASNSSALKALIDSTTNLDSTFIASQNEEIEGLNKQFSSMYNEKQKLLALTGQDSPKFTDYENHAGGLTSLNDLKGKYVYIDMWATWCGPCKAEIPHLKKIEKAYHGKNIEFVSISVDRKNAYDTWKKMVNEKELGGIQLWAKEDKTFADSYSVTGIPRFILIDPQGKIVKADAPRPSSSKLTELFNELNI
ncbi:TlpA disulfide reductase family protein [Postechiella marina]|uniref:TlpA disulfide reductase family protein n=1 Tax=Postechiella marina TaxID=943941 RepID=A0ABP8C6I7_9FLAO